MKRQALLWVQEPNFADFRDVLTKTNEHYTLDYINERFNNVYSDFLGLFLLNEHISTANPISVGRRIAYRNVQSALQKIELPLLVAKISFTEDDLRLSGYRPPATEVNLSLKRKEKTLIEFKMSRTRGVLSWGRNYDIQGLGLTYFPTSVSPFSSTR